ncbi:MAG: hypothetical protein IJU28_08305 [Clostridia bacterium]|nr:hypothetical protein [Clostridia bacterium]
MTPDNASNDYSDVILLSGINIRRNYAHLPFPSRLTDEQFADLRESVLSQLSERFEGIHFDRAAVDRDEALSISQLIEEACFFDEDENCEKAIRLSLSGSTKLSVTVGREDHLNFCAFIRDSDIRHVPGILLPLETALSRQESYAFDPNWGYLTASLRNTGNAMTGVYILSLTGLNRMNLIDEEKENLRKRHIELKRLVGTEEDDCELFCLVSTKQMGQSAGDVLNELSKAAEELVFRERDAREELIYDDTDDYADSVMRALAILMNARLMDFEEFLGMYGDVRAGLATGFVEGSYKDLDDIAQEVSREEIRRNYDDLSERDEELLRADICRRRFSERVKTIRI